MVGMVQHDISERIIRQETQGMDIELVIVAGIVISLVWILWTLWKKKLERMKLRKKNSWLDER